MLARKLSLLFYGTTVAVFVAECAAALAVGQADGLLTAIELHLFAIGLAALWLAHAGQSTNRLGMMLLPMTAIAGPFGAGICLIAAFVHARHSADAVSPSEWIENMFERKLDIESDRLHERISFGFDDFRAASYVEPFRDILAAGSVLQKQMVVAKIARHFRPAFAPLLLQAVRSSNAAVRVQAATALAKIENEFTSRCIRLENSLKDIPINNPARIELAALYDDYAHAGLLDEMSLRLLRTKAIAIYEACLKEQDNSIWRVRLARLYLRQDHPEKTHEWLQPVIDSAEVPAGAMFWYMEALFRLRKFGDLRKFSINHAATIEQSGGYTCIKETGDLLKAWQNITGEIAPDEVQEQSYAA